MSSLRLLSCVLLTVSGSIFAESQTIPITGLGWSVTVDAPTFVTKKEKPSEGGFSFQANSGNFNLSVLVETPEKAGGNKECFDFYWTKASKNPLIDKLSVETSRNAKFHRAQYTMKSADQVFTVKHVNYYFAFEGKWVDIHISITNPTAKESGLIEAFDKGLGYAKQ